MANIAITSDSHKIIYPELSYKIIGAAFRVANEVGYGLREQIYQRALALELSTLSLKYEAQKPINVNYRGVKAGRLFLDLVVENKIVVEIKVRPNLGYPHIKQVKDYLKNGNYKLAIIIYFTKDGVKYRRVLNPEFKS